MVPEDNFALIASEVFDAILSDDWAMPPQSARLIRIAGENRLEYINTSAPLESE